jgi:hypothetical protein
MNTSRIPNRATVVLQFIRERGDPTFFDIMDNCYVGSHWSVARIIEYLEHIGFLKRDPVKRGVRNKYRVLAGQGSLIRAPWCADGCSREWMR